MAKRDIEGDRIRQKARATAYRRLAIEFPERFDVIHDEEREKLGLPPVQRKVALAS